MFFKTCGRNEAYDVIVLAAHHVAVAVSASNPDDGEGGAVQTEHDIEALNDDAEEAEQEACCRRASLQPTSNSLAS